jgi:hypothetical protein
MKLDSVAVPEDPQRNGIDTRKDSQDPKRVVCYFSGVFVRKMFSEPRR